MNKYDSILGSVGLQKTFFPLTVFSLLKKPMASFESQQNFQRLAGAVKQNNSLHAGDNSSSQQLPTTCTC